MTNETSGISRRTLAKGAAWAVPTVAVAAAAPAYAASKPEIEIDWGNSSACKIPGKSMKHCYDKGYVLWGVFKNNTALAATVTISTMTVGGVLRCLAALVDYASPSTTCTTTLGSLTFNIAAGQTRYIAIFSNSSTDSSSTDVTVDFTYTLGTQAAKSASQSGNVGGDSWSGDNGQGSCKQPNGCVAPPDLCTNPCGAGASTTTSTTSAPTTSTTTSAPTTSTTTSAPTTTTTTAPLVSTTTTT